MGAEATGKPVWEGFDSRGLIRREVMVRTAWRASWDVRRTIR